MTTRFSLSELSEMLDLPVTVLRSAVEALAAQGHLSGETFSFANDNWRVAPQDIKRLQQWVASGVQSGELTVGKSRRRVRGRRKSSPSTE